MSEAPVVLVVGLQKSGTSPLLRLLTSTSAFQNPVRFEGKELWGDDPPFAPTAFPAGRFYQRHGGSLGHELGSAEATPDVAAHLRDALAGKGSARKALVLKNPYNSVRVPWLRSLLPRAHIVAVIRRPLPNVFSLLKKHTPNAHVFREPEDGWWGVKPAGWREQVSEDKLAQCARQWQAVNAKLWADRAGVDRFVPYHRLCGDPGAVVAEIAAATVGEVPEMDPPSLAALDSEHLEGGRLESANRVFKRTGSLELAGAERAGESLEPLSPAQQSAVERICAGTAAQLGLG